MIFDGYENDEDLFNALPDQPPGPDADISLDDLILQREEREARRDFSHCYDSFRVDAVTLPRRLELEDKENAPRNSGKSQKPKATKEKGEAAGAEAGFGGSLAMLDYALPSQPSIQFDYEKAQRDCKPSLLFLNVEESGGETPQKDQMPQAQAGEPCDSPFRLACSPLKKQSPLCVLGRRQSLEKSKRRSPLEVPVPIRPLQPRVANLAKRPNPLCCRLVLKDPRRSMQDVPCPRRKRNPNSRRSFSVSSIAREIFKAAAAPQNPSFQSILSMEYIGTSHLDLEDPYSERCGLCQHEFRVREVVARTHVCQHSFHKACLDQSLYAAGADGAPARCPTCHRVI